MGGVILKLWLLSPPLGQLITLSLHALPSVVQALWGHRGLKRQHGPTTPTSTPPSSAITSGKHSSVLKLQKISLHPSH
ncbi:predicted protein [Sclerotinia sclerotiorum 1980 UF-70]|uniref:Secreted protein n=1 Tax=Sclerotinia sclerotiorum (strain ATCC 18683 / 1980 / Ss-1) TaxID=665079 RepID=A7K6M8_SCLS1|nr:predicted protein [Sclerotinia sclerotiorum 1980 UF-70]EDO00628.1 predicted protein [Sclerotinia sclerotiorum 1980 UF-70]